MEWACILIGFVTGFSICNCLFRIYYKLVGTLKIDHSNKDKDTYLFEIDNLDELSTKKHIVLKVDNNANLSQK